MKTKLFKFLQRPVVVLELIGILLLLACGRLWAEDHSVPGHKSGSNIPTGHGFFSPPDSGALLPTIPSRQAEPISLAGILVDELVARVPQLGSSSDQDQYKSLYGYYGPFYNTTNLDSQVVVLGRSVYILPTDLWEASGLVRNQTAQSVLIKSVTATLRGSHGEVLATVTASVPVSNLRPGEPGSFVISSIVPKSAVSNLEWHVEYEVTQSKPRRFVFDAIDDRSSREGSLYDLFVTVRSEDVNATRRVSVVAAWIDDQNRVLYVDFPTARPSDDPATWRAWADLAPNSSQDFMYRTQNRSLVTLLIKARLVLWGVTQ